ncbi:MAG: terminase family protein [Kiritimatiellia bacterium]|jgi:phage terminase large subunit-like protein|nr:terminase family protein [Kiritimatiellia bacterium]
MGKTRAAAEFVRSEVRAGRASRIHLIGKTPADARDVMVEGDSGILAISPPDERPLYEPSKRRLTWPNGARGLIFSSQEPDQLRGPQCGLAWGDEIRTWYYPQECHDNLMLGLRLGERPRAVYTTTPSPISLIKELLKAPHVVVTRGSTYENRANLAELFFSQVIAKYEGTRLGRQEIYAELLEDIPGALWSREVIKYSNAPDLVRVVVAVDPAATSTEQADETGIIVAGVGVDNRGYVLADRSCRLSPNGWANRAVQVYEEYKADCIIAEDNNGGEMVEYTIKTVSPLVKVKRIHASRGKQARAEPVAALYEQGKVLHARAFQELEDQLVTWSPEAGKSPDRLDALVWGLAELMLQARRWLPVGD